MTTETHVYKVTFHDATKCHVLASSTPRAITAAVRWRNFGNDVALEFGARKAAEGKYAPRDVRDVEWICRVDRVPRGKS